ncbi:MAG: hypothetical protein PHQ14_11755 [Chromatiales bacterium]|jgi:intracellular sulfur oxidation DsrE/DsrF family protein|nr:hypothetical protein [Chromatiales bacterium]MDX9768073.1 hypothetical protein [Ectothiorhodospiraceae bacterium]
MDKNELPGDEILNAFVDGEICAEERLRHLQALGDSEAARRKVCDLYRVKEMVNAAYRHPPQPRSRRPSRQQRLGARAAVAAALMLGSLLGAALMFGDRASIPNGRALPVAAIEAGTVMPMRHADRILVHVTHDDRARIREMLDQVEHLLVEAETAGTSLQVMVVTNGEGLNLLRRDTAPFPERVAAMAERFGEHLSFIACNNTLQRLLREEGLRVDLLPQAVMTDSGVAEAIRRQSNGWTYIQV